MSDQFIREIEEDLRRDRLKKLWDRYGMVLIAGAAAIVIGTAGLVFWGNYSERRAAEAGDTFIAAIEASRVGDNAEATRLLNNLIESGGGSYRPLARLRSAALLAEEGDVAAAVAAFDAFEAESNDPLLSDLARIRAAMLLVDTAPHAEIKQRIEDLSGAESAWRHTARELLGLSAYRTGEYVEARRWFDAVLGDPTAPPNVRGRADMLLSLIDGEQADEPAAAGEGNAS